MNGTNTGQSEHISRRANRGAPQESTSNQRLRAWFLIESEPKL
jgi:hypothetical protein